MHVAREQRMRLPGNMDVAPTRALHAVLNQR